MRITIEIKDNKAKAFINFIKSLDFIDIQKEGHDSKLNPEQKKAIDKGIQELNSGKGIDHNKVQSETQEKYPDLLR